MNSIWQFATAPTLKFGRGCRSDLHMQLSRRRLVRPLVVTDSIVGQIDAVREIVATLQQQTSVCVFDRCEAEPSVAVAEAAILVGIAGDVDCVVGIGGGSNLDVAKIAATVLKHGGSPSQYFGFDAIPGPVLPMFALPTTAGTGSEVSHSAVLTDTSQAVKVSTLSAWLRPICAFVDPDLSDSCPPRVTAHSGIDALVHAIEAYTNRDFTQMVDVDAQARAYEGSYPLTKLLAAEAIRLVGRALIPAYAQPNPRLARDEMALAATLAGMAFSNSGVGIVHALEYPIGVLTHCSHGEGNGLLLPHVMRYNLPVRTAEFAEIAGWLGCDVNGKSALQAAEMAIEAVVAMQLQLGIRTRLSQLGLARESIPAVAAKAFGIKRLMDINPQMPQLKDLEEILEQAY